MAIIQDVFLGIALGDAFGVGLETCDRDWLQQNVDFTRYTSLRTGRYTQGYRLGDYSDDTSDTLAIAKLLNSEVSFTIDSLYQALKEEWEISKLDRNGVPRAGFGSILKVFEGKTTLKELQDWQRIRAYPGNAPTMRSIPFGFLSWGPYGDNIYRHCEVNTNITHPNSKALASSLVIAYATKFFLGPLQAKKEELLEACANAVEFCDLETSEYLRRIDNLPSILAETDYEILLGPQPIPNFMKEGQTIRGLNSDAMRTAGAVLYILKHTNSAFEALKGSIYMGGDVDSLAALTVGLSAGRYGISDIPQTLFDGLENSKYVIEVAKTFEGNLKVY